MEIYEIDDNTSPIEMVLKLIIQLRINIVTEMNENNLILNNIRTGKTLYCLRNRNKKKNQK